MWFIAVEVEQETSAPPPKKKPGSAPEPYRGLTAVYKQAPLCSRIRVQTANNSGNGVQIWTKNYIWILILRFGTPPPSGSSSHFIFFLIIYLWAFMADI